MIARILTNHSNEYRAANAPNPKTTKLSLFCSIFSLFVVLILVFTLIVKLKNNNILFYHYRRKLYKPNTQWWLTQQDSCYWQPSFLFSLRAFHRSASASWSTKKTLMTITKTTANGKEGILVIAWSLIPYWGRLSRTNQWVNIYRDWLQDDS